MIRMTMIVTDASVELCRQLAALVAGDAGAGMWETPCSQSGQMPATHWISSGLIAPEFVALLESPQSLSVGAAELGATIPLPEATAVLSGAVVSGDDPFVAMDRLGLRLIGGDSD